jgi:hypothetical protein
MWFSDRNSPLRRSPPAKGVGKVVEAARARKPDRAISIDGSSEPPDRPLNAGLMAMPILPLAA